MRRLIAAAAVGALAIGLAPPASAAPGDPVPIPDPGLQECIAHALKVDVASSYTEAQLESLEDLDCNSDDFWADVSNLSGLEKATKLATFRTYGSSLTDVGPLSGLPLSDLRLWSGDNLDLAPLAGMSSLEALDYYSGTTNPPTIPNFQNLVELKLSSVPISVISASTLPKLTTLTVEGSGESPSDLSMLPSLPELTDLDVRYLEMAAIPALDLPKLTSLTVRGAGLTDISGLSSLTKLTTLDLSVNQITTIPSSLDLSKLEHADLDWNQISSIANMPAMPALQRLELAYNRLTTLPALNLPKLDELALAHNQISSISATTALPELNWISLVGNKVTNVAPLKSYPALSQVFVNGNQITDLSNLGTTYPFKGQLHATRQRLTAATTKACTLVPLPTVKGAPDSKHPIVWDLPTGVVKSGSNIIYPEIGADRSYWIEFSQLGRFTRSDSRDDTYFSGDYSQRVQRATAILAPIPTIAGSVRYGSRVSVRVGSWCPAATKLSYQWLRNGVPIAKATGAAYTLSLADVDKKISVRVTGTRSGMPTVVKTSAQAVVAKATLGAKTPAISGTAKKGKTLKVTMSAWSPAPVKISYQWLRNGTAIKKATKSSYKLTKKDRKKYISVRVTGSKAGYATTSRTSAKTAKVK